MADAVSWRFTNTGNTHVERIPGFIFATDHPFRAGISGV
jgi:hypothetical protein